MDSCFVKIEDWDYLLEFDSERRKIRVWHHITPNDWGYGTEVDFSLDYDYFKRNSVSQFYKMVCGKHISPVKSVYNEERELQEISSALRNRGILS